MDIRTCEIIDGNLPRRQQKLVLAWAELHQEELMADWNLIMNPLGVHSPQLAASSSYRRKPVSRGPDWIPCQARNDGPEQKTIPRSLLRSSSFEGIDTMIVTAQVFRLKTESYTFSHKAESSHVRSSRFLPLKAFSLQAIYLFDAL